MDLGVYREALTQQQLPPTVDQEMDKMVSQLKRLRLSKIELAVAV